MFQRYTELARRAIFFARFHASEFGSDCIDTGHILLALLREEPVLAREAPLETIREQVSSRLPRGKRSATSVDLPLSRDAMSALSHAAKEADGLGSRFIDSSHLVLGLLRVEKCVAAEILRENGVSYDRFRELIRDRASEAPDGGYGASLSEGEFMPEPGEAIPLAAAPSLVMAVSRLEGLIEASVTFLREFTEAEAARPLAKTGRPRAEAMGHLVDWATAHHQWFGRALTEPRLAAGGYPPESQARAQLYDSYPWIDLVSLWEEINRLLLHVIAQAPEEKLDTPCRIGIKEPIPLSKLVDDYLVYCENVLGQILSRR